MNGEPAPAGKDRRGFLNWLLGSSLGASAAMIVYPVLRFILPPEVAEAQGVSSPVAKVGEIPVGSGKVVRFGSRPALVIREAASSFLAFEATCTHLSCTVQYRSDVRQIWCACHNGFYDLTGKNIAGPPPRPLSPLKVNVSGDDVVLTRS